MHVVVFGSMTPTPVHTTAANIKKIIKRQTSYLLPTTHHNSIFPSLSSTPADALKDTSWQLPATNKLWRLCWGLTTSPNPAWHPVINKLLEAARSWINAKKHHPNEICREILQSRKMLREKWHCQSVNSIQAAVPGPWQSQCNVNRVTPNLSKSLSTTKITMNTTI